MAVKRVDKRRMDELRVEVQVKESFKKTLVRNMFKWSAHVERMQIKNWQRYQMPRKRRGKAGRKTENVLGGMC